LYTPLPVPNYPWQDVSMNFVLGLQKTLKKHNSVLVIVDRFSKMTHFLIYSQLSMLLGLLRYSLMVLSNYMVCLRPLCLIEMKFTSYFWKTLRHMSGAKLKFSTIFHTQIDGQTEVVNRSLENLLRILVSEHTGSWDLKLVTAEFAYNTAVNRTTRKSAHEIVYDFRPKQPIDLILISIILEHQILNHHLHDVHKLWIKLLKITPTTS